MQKRGKKQGINAGKKLRELRKRLGAGVVCRPRPLGLSCVEFDRNEAKTNPTECDNPRGSDAIDNLSTPP
jgi:hypothetical protein